MIAADLSRCTRYYDRVIQLQPLQGDTGLLLERIEAPAKSVASEVGALPSLAGERANRTAILINGNLNHSTDILTQLRGLKADLARTSRILLVLYNPYLNWLYWLANRLGIRAGALPTTFLTRTELTDLATLAGFEVVRAHTVGYSPWRLMGIGTLVNRFLTLVPGLRWLGLAYTVTLRPILPERTGRPSLSVVVPARNERGNIEEAVKCMPDLGCEVELIFVEGHSTDGTWDEIRRVAAAYDGPVKIRAVQQEGRGKADAVRLGFSEARGDLLTILDADLTVPPQLLTQFYTAYCEGHGDFVNGSRLVYPMEGEAMRHLNRLGNLFFAKALGWLLDVQIGDTLCGTKLLARHDHARVQAWRADFGDFDPFGDFELIFPASQLGLGIVDVPIRYRARTYGSTNIRRFRHGLELLRMTLIGLVRIKLGR